jgi:K+-transporting ATPase KdpF subunit
VTTLYWIAGIAAAALFIYLLIAMFLPEKLQ